MSETAKSENLRRIFEQVLGPQEGLGGSEIVALSRENRKLREQAAADKLTIETLRKSKTFYQENYRKAKAAYEKLRDAK